MPGSDGTLELNGFRKTGIFALPDLYQVGSGGLILSMYNGLTVKVSGNTMTLTTAITPGGYGSYLFKRQ
jgi:hypothetical protein